MGGYEGVEPQNSNTESKFTHGSCFMAIAACRARGRALESVKVRRMLQVKSYNALIEIHNSPVQTHVMLL